MSRSIAFKLLPVCVFALAILWHPHLPAHADAGDITALNELEQHFFEHTYAKDATEDRVIRLEKMVYGEARTGDDKSRINDLKGIVQANQDPTVAASSAADADAANKSSGSYSKPTKTAKNQGQSGSYPDPSTQPSGSSQSSPADNVAAASSADYPRVDMLEEVIMGQEYKTLSVKARLAQLETRIFGRASTDDDLSARTDALEVKWQKTLSPAQQAQYDKDLSWVESQVIGQNFSSRPLIERIATLEGVVFPNDHPDYHLPIKDQISTLVSAVHLNAQSGRQNTATAMAPSDSGSGSYGSGSYGSGSYGSGSYQSAPSQRGYSAYNTASGYPQPAHTYPGQSTSSQYGYANQTASPGSYQSPSGYSQAAYQGSSSYPQTAYQPTQQNSAPAQPTQTNEKKSGHPLLKGLAKALGTAASMAASAMGSMSYGNPYYGGMGGYGMGGYGYGYNGIPGSMGIP